eukprot:gnl/TRDRNA2_/TRDRNA2_186446_c0_seq1.p1 gnl/TRDRNA2_/TRDRNA2_186446_c0~~gnl/TRDRNA2_/TRDRNA2_186446_c0_seq1.p1  ORF type:complete len:519 (-),score=88.46 gnl/TRDRNA2_/TRDRNA2_186446_c0_seq1:95-1651(-)
MGGATAPGPLLAAALVAMAGVALIFFWPEEPAGAETTSRAPLERAHEKHLAALTGLRAEGLSGVVEVVDFGDGVGLGLSRPVEEGAVLLRVPETLALDVYRDRICDETRNSTIMQFCWLEHAVIHAVAAQEISRLTGLLLLLVLERRKGLVPELASSATSEVIKILPDVFWQERNGLFSIDADEFRTFGTGTSMEGWREVALNETALAHDFIHNRLPELVEVDTDELTWAYLMLHSHAQWAWPAEQLTEGNIHEEGILDDGIGLPQHVIFLWPLFLARPTPEWEHGVYVHYSEADHMYEAVATRPMAAGEEVHFVDRRLSDASVFCFRGLWLTSRHRVRLSLDVGGIAVEPEAQPILRQYGCSGQPLMLYVEAQKQVDEHLIGCMRMLALATNATRLRRAQSKGWLSAWPRTWLVDQQIEATATELAIFALQQVLDRLSSSGPEIRQRFGGDPLSAHPSAKVREAETMIVVGLLKSMKELQLVSSNEYLFEALRANERQERQVSREWTEWHSRRAKKA